MYFLYCDSCLKILMYSNCRFTKAAYCSCFWRKLLECKHAHIHGFLPLNYHPISSLPYSDRMDLIGNTALTKEPEWMAPEVWLLPSEHYDFSPCLWAVRQFPSDSGAGWKAMAFFTPWKLSSQKLGFFLVTFGFIWGMMLLHFTIQQKTQHESSSVLREQILDLSKRYIKALAEENRNVVDGPYVGTMTAYGE